MPPARGTLTSPSPMRRQPPARWWRSPSNGPAMPHAPWIGIATAPPRIRTMFSLRKRLTAWRPDRLSLGHESRESLQNGGESDRHRLLPGDGVVLADRIQHVRLSAISPAARVSVDRHVCEL